MTASQAGNDDYEAAAPVPRSFAVAKANQTVSFTSTAPDGATVGGSYPVEVSASSGLPVALSAGSEAVCTLDESTVAFVGAGECTVRANQAGDANYDAAPEVTQTLSVVRATTPSILTAVSGSGTYGDSATLRTTLRASSGALAGKTVSFTLNGTPVGDDTTDANGDTTLAVDLADVDAGTYTDAVTASFAGDDEDALAASEALGTLDVTMADQTLSFSSESPTNARVGGSYTVSADATSGLPVFYRSATLEVCTVPASTVNFVGAGECVVVANQPGNGNYNAAPEITQRTTVAASTDGTALSVSGAGTYGGAGTLTATLTTGDTPLSGKSVAFTLSDDERQRRGDP